MLIDEFKLQLNKDWIEHYGCYNSQPHFTKFDLTGRVIKQYANFYHNHGVFNGYGV